MQLIVYQPGFSRNNRRQGRNTVLLNVELPFVAGFIYRSTSISGEVHMTEVHTMFFESIRWLTELYGKDDGESKSTRLRELDEIILHLKEKMKKMLDRSCETRLKMLKFNLFDHLVEGFERFGNGEHWIHRCLKNSMCESTCMQKHTHRRASEMLETDDLMGAQGKKGKERYKGKNCKCGFSSQTNGAGLQDMTFTWFGKRRKTII